jgi:hypothetical protein
MQMEGQANAPDLPSRGIGIGWNEELNQPQPVRWLKAEYGADCHQSRDKDGAITTSSFLSEERAIDQQAQEQAQVQARQKQAKDGDQEQNIATAQEQLQLQLQQQYPTCEEIFGDLYNLDTVLEDEHEVDDDDTNLDFSQYQVINASPSLR